MNYYLKRTILALTGWIPDEAYLRITYLVNMKRILHLKNPKRFSEKIQWLKLYDFKEEYTSLADKIRVADFIENKIGKQYLVPILGVYERAEDIDLSSLPEKFVLKCNHDMGSTKICFDKKTFDFESTKRSLNQHLKTKFYLEGRENVYKSIVPRIIAEQYIGEGDDAPNDYKFFCFNGAIEFIQVDSNRFKKHQQNFFDCNWNELDIDSDCGKADSNDLRCPSKFNEMKKLVERLCEGFRFIRVDLYSINEKIYFGEMTFYPGAGYKEFQPESFSNKLASLIKCD